jgi:hypothetical protein
VIFLQREDLVEWMPRQLTAPVAQIIVAGEGDYVSVTVLQANGVQVRSGLDMYPDDIDLQALAAQLLSEIVCGYAMLAMRRPRAEVHP